MFLQKAPKKMKMNSWDDNSDCNCDDYSHNLVDSTESSSSSSSWHSPCVHRTSPAPRLFKQMQKRQGRNSWRMSKKSNNVTYNRTTQSITSFTTHFSWPCWVWFITRLKTGTKETLVGAEEEKGTWNSHPLHYDNSHLLNVEHGPISSSVWSRVGWQCLSHPHPLRSTWGTSKTGVPHNNAWTVKMWGP